MNITLHADSHTDGSPGMAHHLQTIVQDGLARFGERITSVDAHLSDENGPTKSGDEQIHCLLEARLVGHDPVVVNEHAGNAHLAIDGALRKLKRAVGKAIAIHDPRARRSAGPGPSTQPTGDMTTRSGEPGTTVPDDHDTPTDIARR